MATAVTRGDLNLKIDVDAAGEIQVLQDNINTMIANLRDTTLANKEQDWLKGNLARISGLMQGRRDLEDVASLIMSELTPGGLRAARRVLPGDADRRRHRTSARTAAEDGRTSCGMRGSYGYAMGSMPTSFRPGEALIGTAAEEKRTILVENVPPGYLKISSGLGEAPPAHVIVLPVLFEGQVLGVIELASFQPFTQIQKDFLNQIAEMIATSVNTISVNTKTEVLLKQSQELTEQLRERSGGAGEPAEGAPGVQRRAGGEGRAAGPAEPRHRGEEHRDRGGAAGPGGARRAARRLDALQVASSWRTCRTSCARRSTRC